MPEALDLSFPHTQDADARRAMAAVARAIMRQDLLALDRMVGAHGLKLFGKPTSTKAFADVLARDGAHKLTGIDCAHGCTWSDNVLAVPQGGGSPHGVAMTPDTVSYGLEHVVRLEAQPDGAWRVVEIGTVDLGRDGP